MTDRALLAIFAHPDDETFGPGATLAKYARAGVAVHYLCGTRGEAGTTDPEHLVGFESVGDMRWAELSCAARELALAGVHHLGYRDSGMPGSEHNRHPLALCSQPVEAVAARIAHFIRFLRPQVVMTHDPIGGYRHPDHIMIHNAAVMAFHAAGDPAALPDPEGLPAYRPQKLYYPVFNLRTLRWAVRVLPLFRQDPRKFGRNRDVDITSLTDVEFPVHLTVDVRGEPSEVKVRASACHKSQSIPVPRGPITLFLRALSRRDTFMRAYPPANGRLRESDLFEGTK